MRFIHTVGLCALVAAASPAAAGTFYFNKAAWEAALAGQTINNLSLTPQVLPKDEKPLVVDDEVSIQFDIVESIDPANRTTATGWGGSLLNFPNQIHTATFVSPIIAFGATVGVGFHVGEEDGVRLIFDEGIDLKRPALTSSNFLGWIGNTGLKTMGVDLAGPLNSYSLTNVQYVTAIPPVPLPSALLIGLPMLGLCGLWIRRRHSNTGV